MTNDLLDEVIEIIEPDEGEAKKEQLENRKSFCARLEEFSFEEKEIILFAYDLSKEAHRTQKRDSGERYFEHLRNVALILIDECQIKNPDMIIASLLHDAIEDSPMFGNSTQAYSEWKKVSNFRLKKVFNARVAEMVISLTKPKIDGQELKTKREAHELYITNLTQSSSEIILLKMCDRLHNLRSLKTNTPEKRMKQLQETKEIYLPIFQKVLSIYSKEGAYLLLQMEKIMHTLEKIDN